MNKDAIPLLVRRHKLVATVRKAIGDRDVVVGVSGGVDSVALLLLACAASLQESSNFKVVAAHVHHGLRKESDHEQKFVEELCDSIGVQCVSKRIKVEPLKGSIAAGARKMRYEVLASVAQETACNTVAVAHHAEDQLETMLMALCRGGGLRKLSGMAAVRLLNDEIDLIRPLLNTTKKELVEICNLANVNWCEDSTNCDVSTPRGRLRADVLPILRELWNAADKHAANASTLLHAATDSFEAFVPSGTQWNRNQLAELPQPVIDATLQRAIGEQATFETVQTITAAVLDKSTEPRTFQCKDGCRATVTTHTVSVIHE